MDRSLTGIAVLAGAVVCRYRPPFRDGYWSLGRGFKLSAEIRLTAPKIPGGNGWMVEADPQSSGNLFITD
jgi:hypothetical protein